MIHRFNFVENLLLRFNIIPHPVLDALTYVVAGRGLQISAKLGLFDVLGKKPISIAEIAKKTKADPDGIRQLLNILDALGYVQEQEEKFFLTKRGLKFFSSESDSSMKNTILFSDYVYRSLNDLEQHIKTGGPKDVNLDVFTPRQWDIFNNTMVEIAKSNFQEIANLIPLRKNHKRLLDIGGSHGLHAIEICKKIPGMTAEVMDLEPVKSFAEKVIKEHKMERKVKFRAGDFHKSKFGEGYDIILAFNVIHGLTPDQNQKITEKVFKALNPGGLYVVLDQIKEAEGKSELSRLVSSAQGLMLFNVAGGRTYSFDEVENWMNKSGFTKVRMRKLRNPGNALIISYK